LALDSGDSFRASLILTRSLVAVVDSWATRAQAANYVSFSLGYELELEEKLTARDRGADALWQELSQAKAELAGAKKAAAEVVRSAKEAAVREFRGSTEQVLRFTEHALAGYEKGMGYETCRAAPIPAARPRAACHAGGRRRSTISSVWRRIGAIGFLACRSPQDYAVLG
jgi:hypothetical protein